MTEGWICPRCKKVNAPHIDSCDCPADLPIADYVDLKPMPVFPPHLLEEWTKQIGIKQEYKPPSPNYTVMYGTWIPDLPGGKI